MIAKILDNDNKEIYVGNVPDSFDVGMVIVINGISRMIEDLWYEYENETWFKIFSTEEFETN